MRPFTVLIDSAHDRCTLNLVSSSMMYRYLLENGHRITQQVSDADFIIINTCGFHTISREISVALYNKYQAEKQPNAKIILYGCLIKIEPERVKSLDAQLVDFTDGKILDNFFFKTKRFDEMTSYCDSTTRNILCNTSGHLDFSSHQNFFLSRLMFPFSKIMKMNYDRFIQGLDHQNKMVVEVSRGCVGNCHYCVIKKAKGALKSRPIDAILSDIRRMYDPSKTLYLVGDDCSCYGMDIHTTIFELIHRIQDEFPHLAIQINYISPNILVKFEQHYIDLVKTSQIGYVTIPLQSGSMKIVHAMNRFYDPHEVIAIIHKIKRLSPTTLIEGHFIVGYPGETTIDFIKSLLASFHFDYPIPLLYSDNIGVKSSTLPHKKSAATKYLRVFLMFMVTNCIVFYRLLTTPSGNHDKHSS